MTKADIINEISEKHSDKPSFQRIELVATQTDIAKKALDAAIDYIERKYAQQPEKLQEIVEILNIPHVRNEPPLRILKRSLSVVLFEPQGEKNKDHFPKGVIRFIAAPDTSDSTILGGHGRVYPAYDLIADRAVAIKERNKQSSDPEENESHALSQEGIRHAGNEHPHVLPIQMTALTPHGETALVLRYIGSGNGFDLSRIIWARNLAREQNGGQKPDTLLAFLKISLSELCTVIEQIADAIDFCIENGKPNRDIKPGNILFDLSRSQIHPYITDFGDTRFTGGTPYFKSPERYFEQDEYENVVSWTEDDEKLSELYSFAQTLYFLFTGKRLNTTQMSSENLSHIEENQLLLEIENSQDPATAHNGALPQELAEWGLSTYQIQEICGAFQHALSFHPKDRVYKSSTEFARVLAQYMIADENKKESEEPLSPIARKFVVLLIKRLLKK